MAETDILPLDPDYPIQERIQSGVLRQSGASGKDLQRQLRPDQRVFDLEFTSRSTDDIETLRAFCARLRGEHFLFNHKTYVNNAGVYLPRYFPVIFAQDPEMTLQMNESWPAHLQLLEAPGRSLGPLLFANTDFDKWTAGALDNWTNPGGADGAGGSENQLDVQSGSAYQIVGDGVSNTRGARTQAAATIIKPNTLYTACVWMKRTAGLAAGTATIRLFGTGVSTTGISIPYSTLTTSYQRFTADLASGGLSSTPSDLVLQVFVTNTPTNAQAVLIDRLIIVEGALAADGLWPDPAGGHQVFLIEENDPRAAALAGTWTDILTSSASARKLKLNSNLNTTDAFQWTYVGYGFELRVMRTLNHGISKVVVDGSDMGFINAYDPGEVANAVRFRKIDLPLGIHRVQIKATNTKEPASSGYNISADALGVIL